MSVPCSGWPASPGRRTSMSAAAAPFIPTQLPLFSRQSVPAVLSRSSALHIEEPASRDSTATGVVMPSRASLPIGPGKSLIDPPCTLL